MGRNMITTDAQHLGLPFFQSAMVTPEGDGLFRSTTGEVKDVKGQDDVFLAVVLAQADIAFADRRQRKIRGDFANFSRHCYSFPQVVNHTDGRYLSILHFVVPATRIPVVSFPRVRRDFR